MKDKRKSHASKLKKKQIPNMASKLKNDKSAGTDKTISEMMK